MSQTYLGQLRKYASNDVASIWMSCSGGFAGFGLGKQSGFAGGEDSFGSGGG